MEDGEIGNIRFEEVFLLFMAALISEIKT
jgi:hypothetical protein